jgi:hypothetical protein
VSFDGDGNIATVKLFEAATKDIKNLNRLKHLQSMYVVGGIGSDQSKTVNFSDLEARPTLASMQLSRFPIHQVSSVCRFKSLAFLNINRANLFEDFKLDGCLSSLSTLSVYLTNGSRLIV